MSGRVIAVIGATGTQGGGTVAALLNSDSDFTVRAISSNPASPHAKALLLKHADMVLNGRLKMVKGDLKDQSSLEKALKGAYGLFAAFPYLPETPAPGEPTEVELGKNLVNAAKACEIEHFVFSSLPNVRKASNGRLTHVSHFDSKATIEEYARKELPTVTVLIPSVFYSNLRSPLYCDRAADGTVVFRPPLKPTTLVRWVDDTHDIGIFASAVFSKGPLHTGGRTYPIETPPTTFPQIAAQYQQITGEKAIFDPLSMEKALELVSSRTGLGMIKEFEEMFLWLDAAPGDKAAYGTMDEKDTSFEDLGVKASTFEEFLERSGWRAVTH
ncbi:hypothetical protein JCM21900_004821 [Sporobolomyces salmonicolor]